jgi:hypothetical protein
MAIQRYSDVRFVHFVDDLAALVYIIHGIPPKPLLLSRMLNSGGFFFFWLLAQEWSGPIALHTMRQAQMESSTV